MQQQYTRVREKWERGGWGGGVGRGGGVKERRHIRMRQIRMGKNSLFQKTKQNVVLAYLTGCNLLTL